MSPEDEARTRLLAHYDRIRTDAVRRLARLQEHLAGATDHSAALELRTRIEGLRSVIEDMESRAKRIRQAVDQSRCSSET
jgi:hypothetical protein